MSSDRELAKLIKQTIGISCECYRGWWMYRDVTPHGVRWRVCPVSRFGPQGEHYTRREARTFIDALEAAPNIVREPHWWKEAVVNLVFGEDFVCEN